MGAEVFVDAIESSVVEGYVPFDVVPGLGFPPVSGGMPWAGVGGYFAGGSRRVDIGGYVLMQVDLSVFVGSVAAED